MHYHRSAKHRNSRTQGVRYTAALGNAKRPTRCTLVLTRRLPEGGRAGPRRRDGAACVRADNPVGAAGALPGALPQHGVDELQRPPWVPRHLARGSHVCPRRSKV
jgi:hypothetical protein